jgi:hypothetical protein
MQYTQVTGTFKAEPFSDDMLYAQVKYGVNLPKGLYFCSASYNLGPDGFSIGSYAVTSSVTRRPNNEVKLGDMLVTKVGEDRMCDVLPEAMFKEIYKQKPLEKKDISAKAYAKLDTLLNDWTVFPPFKREDTVVCMGPDDLEEMLEYIRSMWGYGDIGQAIKRLTFSTHPLPRILGVMICDKRRHILIDQLNQEYNIVVMPDDPLGCKCYKAKVMASPVMKSTPKVPEKDRDVRLTGYPGQTYYHILLTKNQLWKVRNTLTQIEELMRNHPQGHLKDDDVEFIWENGVFSVKIYGMEMPRMPSPPKY